MVHLVWRIVVRLQRLLSTTPFSHIEVDYLELVELLGLPPGYRFLKAGTHLDIWFDPKLLESL